MWSNSKSQSAEACWLQDKFSIRKLLPPSREEESNDDDNFNSQPKARRRTNRASLSSSSSSLLYRRRQVEIENLIAPVALSILFVSFILSAQQQLTEATNSRDDNNDDIFLSSSPLSGHHHNHKYPQFVEPETADNVQRVPVGRSVKFKCVVNNLGSHRVAWFHKDKRILLALDNKTIVWKDRIHATSQGDSVFYLQIDSVQLGDKGHYICQLNTQPVQSQVHILEVSKSPQIKEQDTTINIEPVKEFSPVELRCVADGIPKPSIKWRRESKMHVIPMEDGEAEEEATEEADNDRGIAGGGNEIDGVQVQTGDSNSRIVGPQMALWTTKQFIGLEASDLSRDHKLTADGATTSSSSLPVSTSLLDDNINNNNNNNSSSSSSRRRRRRSRQDSARVDVLNSQNGGKSSSLVQTASLSSATSSSSPTSNGGGIAATYDPSKTFIGEGEVLRFDRVTRYDMGFYMCIASNGVPPSVSQRIFLPVSFIQKASVSSLRALTSNGRSGKNLDTTSTGVSSGGASGGIAGKQNGANSSEVSSNGVNLLPTTTRPRDGSGGRSAAAIARQHRKQQRIGNTVRTEDYRASRQQRHRKMLQMADEWTKLLTKAEYKYVEYTRQDILNAVLCFKFLPLTSSYGPYTNSKGKTRDLIWLDGTIRVTRLGASFNILIGLAIHPEHPVVVPERYIKLAKNAETKTSRPDDEGRIFLPPLSAWSEDKSNLISIIKRMQVIIEQMNPNQNIVGTPNHQPPPQTIPPEVSTPRRPNLLGFIKHREEKMKTLISYVEVRLRCMERLKEIHGDLESLMGTWDDLNCNKIQINDLEATMDGADEKLQEIGFKLLVWEYSIVENCVKPTTPILLKPRWRLLLDNVKRALNKGKV